MIQVRSFIASRIHLFIDSQILFIISVLVFIKLVYWISQHIPLEMFYTIYQTTKKTYQHKICPRNVKIQKNTTSFSNHFHTRTKTRTDSKVAQKLMYPITWPLSLLRLNFVTSRLWMELESTCKVKRFEYSQGEVLTEMSLLHVRHTIFERGLDQDTFQVFQNISCHDIEVRYINLATSTFLYYECHVNKRQEKKLQVNTFNIIL